MQEYHDTINKIKSILKDDFRGMTITDIAKKLEMSRTSIGKYLDILLVSGFVEVKKFGSAKVYFLSDRIPLSTMLNFTSDQILVLDRNFTISQVNQSFLDAWHFDREDIIGEDIKNTHLPFLVIEFYTNLKIALNGNENKIEINFEFDSSKYFLDIKFIPTTFETGYPGVTLIIEDNSEKKLQEFALNESQNRMIAITNNSFDAIWESDIKGILTYVSDQHYQIWGYEPEELLYQPFAKIVWDENENNRIMKDYTDFISQKAKITDYILLGRTKNGDKIINEVNAVPKFNEQGEVIGYLGTTRNITSKYQFQKALEQSQEMYKSLVENLPVVTWRSTKEGKTTYISPNVEYIYGYTPEEILEAGEELWFGRIHEEDKQRVIKQFQATFSEKKPFDIEYRIQKKDGNWIKIHDRAVLVTNEENQPVIYGVFEDITNNKKI